MSACHLNRLQKAVNFGARIVSGARRREHISPVLAELGWRRVQDLVTQRDCISVHRALNDPCAPESIRTMFTRRADISQRATRAAAAGALEPPAFRLSATRRLFPYRAVLSWNRLSPAITASFTHRVCDLSQCDVSSLI